MNKNSNPINVKHSMFDFTNETESSEILELFRPKPEDKRNINLDKGNIRERTEGYKEEKPVAWEISGNEDGKGESNEDEKGESNESVITKPLSILDREIIKIDNEYDKKPLTVKEIENIREKLTIAVRDLYNHPRPFQDTKAIADARQVSQELLEKDQCFLCTGIEYIMEVLGDRYYDPGLGFVQDTTTLFKERFIIPVRDFKGMVAGFVGWDNISLPKYINSNNPGYKRGLSFLGMEHYKDYLREGMVIVVEGVFDYYALRTLNLPVLGSLGVFLSRQQLQYLQPFNKVIYISDADITGDKAMVQYRKKHNMSVITLEKTVDDLYTSNESFDEDETYDTKPKDIDQYIKDFGSVTLLKAIDEIRQSYHPQTKILKMR